MRLALQVPILGSSNSNRDRCQNDHVSRASDRTKSPRPPILGSQYNNSYIYNFFLGSLAIDDSRSRMGLPKSKCGAYLKLPVFCELSWVELTWLFRVYPLWSTYKKSPKVTTKSHSLYLMWLFQVHKWVEFCDFFESLLLLNSIWLYITRVISILLIIFNL